jgi:UPF0755 protein
MSDGGWYGYPPQQEPDPYAQPQDDWSRPPLDYGDAAQANGYEQYDQYGQQTQAAQQAQAQAQYYAQQQQQAAAQQQAQQQAQQLAQQQAQQLAQQQQRAQQAARRPQQQGQPPQGQYDRQRPPQHPQSQNPYFDQQQQQQQQQGYGYDSGSYPGAQQYSTGEQPRVGYETHRQQPGYDTGSQPRQAGYERTGYDTATGYPNQGYESASSYEQASYGSGSYDTGTTGGQGGGRGRGATRDAYSDLAELGEVPDEFEYPNRAGRRRPETTGPQTRVEDDSRLNLLDREETARKPAAFLDDDDDDDDDRKGKKSRRSCLVIFLFFAILAGAIGYGGVQAHKYYESHYGPPADYSSTTGVSATAIVAIPENVTGTQIGALLFNAGVVKSQRAFTDACNANPQCGNIQSATYQLHKQMSAAGAVTALLNSANIYNKSQLLVRPGERAADVFTDLEQKTGWTQAAIVSAVNGGQVDLPSYATAKTGTKYPFANVEGLLFTGTYQLTAYKSPTPLIKKMIDDQLAMFTAIGLTQKAQSLQMTPYQVLTVASMARAEAGGNPADLGKIAGVIYDRLKNSDFSKLGFDTATLYGLGRTTPQPTANELADKANPYNLRVIAGLPPGPIDSVDQMALTSALAPSDSTDVFFCAVNGTVHYAANNTQWAALGKEFPGSCG